MRGPLAALALGSAAALALLYAGEAGLRMTAADPGLEAMAAAEAAGTPFDPRTRSQVVAELRAQGRDAVPRLVPAALLEEAPDGTLRSRLSSDDAGGGELLPLAGISRRTTVLCNETGRWAVYESDEHGFRNPPGTWRLAPVDAVLLGDSFTIGECVGPGENVADRLRARRPATVNLGYSGDSPLLELATLVEYGPRLRPRVVLWVFFENDVAWFDLGRSSRAPLLMRYLEESRVQALLERQPEIDARLSALLDSLVAQPDHAGPVSHLERVRPSFAEQARGFAALRALRARAAGLVGRVREPREPADWALFSRVLARARSVASAWDGEVVVVFLPGVWNFAPGEAPGFADPEDRRRVREVAASLGLRFVDTQTALAAHPDPLSLYAYRGDSILGSPHMNGAGYAVVAELLEAVLAETLDGSARRSQISRQ